MDFGLFFAFLMTTGILAFTFSYFLYNPYKLPTQIKDLSCQCGLAVIVAAMIVWALADLSVPRAEWFTPFGVFPFILGALGLSFYSLEKGGRINRFWVYLFTTMTCVWFFPANMTLTGGLIPLFIERIGIAVLWALFIHLYVSVDKVSELTLLQSIAFMIGFSFLLLYPKVFPNTLSYDALFVVSALTGFIIYKRKYPNLTLGRTGAAPLGFLSGFFFSAMAFKGMYGAALIMPAYIYFEWAYSRLYRFKTRAMPEPAPYNFFVIQQMRSHLNTAGISQFLLRIMLLLAVLGILAGFTRDKMLMGALLLVVFVLYYVTGRLKSWGMPKPRFKDVFTDMKKAGKLLIDMTKDNLNKK